MKNKTYLEIQQRAIAKLCEFGLDEFTAKFETNCLIEHCFGYNKHSLLLHKNSVPTQEKAIIFEKKLAKRLTSYPLQYILGEWEFYGYNFAVGEGVLIPRADTEILAETAIEIAKKGFTKPKIADLCSGSGCLPIVFSKEIPHAEKIYAVELSELAFPYLERNIELNSCKNIIAVKGDVLTWEAPEKMNIITSNPPYLSHEEMSNLQAEVRFEPEMALEAEENGLYFYHKISEKYFDKIDNGGYLIFEVGYTQAEAVAEIMIKNGFKNIQKVKDYNNVERVVFGQKIE